MVCHPVYSGYLWLVAVFRYFDVALHLDGDMVPVYSSVSGTSPF
jgi:hypothetical protein